MIQTSSRGTSFRSPLTAARKTYEALWDAYKMIDALNIDGVEASYLLVGASVKDWDAMYKNCLARLVPLAPGRPRSANAIRNWHQEAFRGVHLSLFETDRGIGMG